MNSLITNFRLAADIGALFKTIIGGEPDPFQRRILENDPQHLLVLASRQAGKSAAAQVRAVYECAFVPDSLTILLSAGLRQSVELMRGCAKGIQALGTGSAIVLESALRIEVRGGGRIISLPASESTVRGWSKCSLLILDEAAKIEKAVIEAAFPSTAACPDARIWVLSTPGPKVGIGEWFYRRWLSTDEGWCRETVKWNECPRLKAEWVKSQSRIIGAAAARAEFDAEFVDDTGSMWSVDDIEACINPKLIATSY